jgi:hypothetical protein
LSCIRNKSFGPATLDNSFSAITIPAFVVGAPLAHPPAPTTVVDIVMQATELIPTVLKTFLNGSSRPTSFVYYLLYQVRDTAWAPCLGPARQVIASCGQDRRVVIWTCREGGTWTPR